MSGFRAVFSHVIASVFLLATARGGLSAANYHYGNTLYCSDCHSTHASQRHDSQGEALAWDGSPNRKLLTSSTTTDICLRCHDNQSGIPDVVGDDINNPSEEYDGSERAGGRFEVGSSDNWKGHNLPGQEDSDPGGCISCHDPHGNTNYRNLRALDGSDDGPIAFVNPMATGLEKYQRSNVAYVQGIGDKLCGACHGYGTAGSTIATGGRGHYHRHPSSSIGLVVTMGMSDAHIDASHWVGGMGSGFESRGGEIPRVPFAVSLASSYAAASTVSVNNEVFCLSCHKAHGSVHSFSMLWPYGYGDGEIGNSGCNQCHNISSG